MIRPAPKTAPKSPMGRNRMPSAAPAAPDAYGAGSGMGRLAKAGMAPAAPSAKKPVRKR